MDKIIIQGLKVKCVIGDYTWERKRPQKVIFDIEIEGDFSDVCKEDVLSKTSLDYNKLAKEILKFVEKSSYHLVETLAEAVAQLTLKKFPVEAIRVRLTKPAAIKAADAAIIEIYRK